MVKGAFKSLKHTHKFRSQDGGTLMIDILEFRSPLGWIGRLFDKLVLERYMKNFLIRRNTSLKEIVEKESN